MSDDDDGTSHASAAGAAEASGGWSDQDRRTLIITIGGTLVGNVATVILVGAAIALARVGKGPASGSLLSSLIAIVLGLILVVGGVVVRRRRGSGWRAPVSVGRVPLLPRSWVIWYLLVPGCLFLLEGVLIVVGVAAGVK